MLSSSFRPTLKPSTGFFVSSARTTQQARHRHRATQMSGTKGENGDPRFVAHPASSPHALPQLPSHSHAQYIRASTSWLAMREQSSGGCGSQRTPTFQLISQQDGAVVGALCFGGRHGGCRQQRQLRHTSASEQRRASEATAATARLPPSVAMACASIRRYDQHHSINLWFAFLVLIQVFGSLTVLCILQ